MTEDDFESINIYLAKDGEDGYIGLHSVGFHDGTQWCAMESWGNVYGLDYKFRYSAFRIFGTLEESKEEFVKDGWKEIEWPNENGT